MYMRGHHDICEQPKIAALPILVDNGKYEIALRRCEHCNSTRDVRSHEKNTIAILNPPQPRHDRGIVARLFRGGDFFLDAYRCPVARKSPGSEEPGYNN